MFKSCGKIIFWQKLCSLRQAMPWCVSFRRGGFQRDFPYGASNQPADSFWTWHRWCMNQGSEGTRVYTWSYWWELMASHRGGALTVHTLALMAVFQAWCTYNVAPSKTCAHSAVHFMGSCPELNLLSLKICHWASQRSLNLWWFSQMCLRGDERNFTWGGSHMQSEWASSVYSQIFAPEGWKVPKGQSVQSPGCKQLQVWKPTQACSPFLKKIKIT